MTDVVKGGFLEVYCGPMNSGKTREMLNKIDKIQHSPRTKVLVVKPRIDTRDEKIKSRFGSLSAECVFADEKNPEEILSHLKEENVIAIDEAHFFSEGIEDVIHFLLKNRKHIIVAGLDLDFRGEPFGRMPNILALADKVHKLTAVCEHKGCTSLATRTQRTLNGKPAHYNSPTVLIGDDKEGYAAVCIKHHKVEK